jgi:beta-1,4-N-acetylglucosaminyltransferase
MKNVLVTVGTTKFNSLVKYLDHHLPKIKNIDATFQVSKGGLRPHNYKWFEFDKDITDYYMKADVIVCHAGAGTIFRLLELKRKILMVPNFDRVDSHQREICEYMAAHGHAVFCPKFDDIMIKLDAIDSIQLKPYIKDEFQKFDEIFDVILR